MIPSRAVDESFNPDAYAEGIVAAHGPGTKRSDRALGCCSPKTQQGNRRDRRRDRTHSTGRNTRPGKLTGRHQELVAFFDRCRNVSKTARHFHVTNPAIRRILKMHGRK
jgi:hypothetical protein